MVPACAAAQAAQAAEGVPSSAPCDEARQLCAGTAATDDLMYWIFYEVDDPSPNRWRWNGQQCMTPGQAGAAAAPALTLEAFRRLPLPAGGVRVQPPSGRTLINVPTNMFVDADPVLLDTTVLGAAVKVRATPVLFRWTFGDGAKLETADPGAPYPALRTAHTYSSAGRRQVNLVTEYTGEYSVGGGPWLPVQGRAAVASPPVVLTVLAARNHLVP